MLFGNVYLASPFRLLPKTIFIFIYMYFLSLYFSSKGKWCGFSHVTVGQVESKPLSEGYKTFTCMTWPLEMEGVKWLLTNKDYRILFLMVISLSQRLWLCSLSTLYWWRGLYCAYWGTVQYTIFLFVLRSQSRTECLCFGGYRTYDTFSVCVLGPNHDPVSTVSCQENNIQSLAICFRNRVWPILCNIRHRFCSIRTCCLTDDNGTPCLKYRHNNICFFLCLFLVFVDTAFHHDYTILNCFVLNNLNRCPPTCSWSGVFIHCFIE